MRIVDARTTELRVPLREPFVIATARMDTTRAALVTLVTESNVSSLSSAAARHTGIGEAACLPPVTWEDLPDVLSAASKGLGTLFGRTLDRPEDAAGLAEEASAGSPVLAAAVECALVDALARSRGLSVRALFGETGTARTVESDITLSIGDEGDMLRSARDWYSRGFRAFKVKVGKDADREARAICTLHTSLPGVRFRLDANAGYGPREALATLATLRACGAHVECFEQPCAREDLDGMARVVKEGAVDVVADESLRGDADLDALIAARAATSVNLKLVKLGGFGPALALGRRALASGLGLMVGGMVETRLGMTCAATLVATLGRVAYADLDTAWLLADDPFEGGFSSDGPHLTVLEGPGFTVSERPRTNEA